MDSASEAVLCQELGKLLHLERALDLEKSRKDVEELKKQSLAPGGTSVVSRIQRLLENNKQKKILVPPGALGAAGAGFTVRSIREYFITPSKASTILQIIEKFRNFLASLRTPDRFHPT